MAYKVIILYQLYMPSYFLGTFTEYPYIDMHRIRNIKYGPLQPVASTQTDLPDNCNVSNFSVIGA